MSFERIGIIGLGLMGGSLALALKQAGAAKHIEGCGRPERLRQALALGLIDSGCEQPSETASRCDLIFLCTPIAVSIAQLTQLAPHLKPGALVTDVGSTKREFAEAARAAFGANAVECVLPGHPLAGKELSGLANATADLYRGCLWLLTPLGGGELTAAQSELRATLESIGANIEFADPVEHDRTLAFTSHLPQMLSTALSLALQQAFDKEDPSLQHHAGGLLSMLRLAVSDPVMWEQVAASNPANIAAALETMEAQLASLRRSLGSPEFRQRFDQARDFALNLRKLRENPEVR